MMMYTNDFYFFKVGVNMKAVLAVISRKCFKQSIISFLIPHINVLDCVVNFSVIFMYN